MTRTYELQCLPTYSQPVTTQEDLIVAITSCMYIESVKLFRL